MYLGGSVRADLLANPITVEATRQVIVLEVSRGTRDQKGIDPLSATQRVTCSDDEGREESEGTRSGDGGNSGRIHC